MLLYQQLFAAPIEIEVYDYDVGSKDDSLGTTRIDLHERLQELLSGEFVSVAVELADDGQAVHGVVHMDISWHPRDDVSLPAIPNLTDPKAKQGVYVQMRTLVIGLRN